MKRRHLSFLMTWVAALSSLLGCGTGTVEGGNDVPLTAVETPVFLPPPGEFAGPLEVSIQTPTFGTTIHYTVGAIPEQPTESSAVYMGPLTISETTTIAAKAFKAGMSPSATAQASYTIVTDCTPACTCELTTGQNCKASCASGESQVADTCAAGAFCCKPTETAATPAFSPGGGAFSAPQAVAITTATDGATIYFTLDETTPNEDSPEYSSPIAVSSTTTIKARAFKDGMSPSDTASATYTISTVSGVPAFPGAQGGGAESVGGRGGQVIHVTNLDSEGPGSLREAIYASGPRIVVFDVAGVIHLQRTAANPEGFIDVTNPYLTVAGQTAPGGGITVRGDIMMHTHDVIIRFISMRSGKIHSDFLFSAAMDVGSGVHNLIVDHVSVSWANDDSINMWPGSPASNLTFSWSLIAEGMRDEDYSYGGDPSKGMMFGGENVNTTNVAVHHSALMKFTDRMPQTNITDIMIANNIMYYRLWEFTMVFGGAKADIIGNIYKEKEPVNQKEVHGFARTGDGYVPGDPSIFIQGNIGPNQSDPADDNWQMVSSSATGSSAPVSWRRTTPLPAPVYPVTIHSVDVLEAIVLEDVGNSRRLDENGDWVRRRDSVDTRLVNEYRTNTGTLPYHEDEVGGWPVIDPGTPYADTDRDGMPNAWELGHGLEPNNPSDANGDSDGDGYNNIEEFLNGNNL